MANRTDGLHYGAQPRDSNDNPVPVADRCEAVTAVPDDNNLAVITVPPRAAQVSIQALDDDDERVPFALLNDPPHEPDEGEANEWLEPSGMLAGVGCAGVDVLRVRSEDATRVQCLFELLREPGAGGFSLDGELGPVVDGDTYPEGA